MERFTESTLPITIRHKTLKTRRTENMVSIEEPLPVLLLTPLLNSSMVVGDDDHEIDCTRDPHQDEDEEVDVTVLENSKYRVAFHVPRYVHLH